jgi:hypothetical protein
MTFLLRLLSGVDFESFDLESLESFIRCYNGRATTKTNLLCELPWISSNDSEYKRAQKEQGLTVPVAAFGTAGGQPQKRIFRNSLRFHRMMLRQKKKELTARLPRQDKVLLQHYHCHSLTPP